MNNLLKKKIASLPDPTHDGNTLSSDTSVLPNSAMEAIARGTMAPTSAMLGQRENLAPSLQVKMQGAFGADFSNLEVYRSQTARDAGFNGIASGNKVALAPDIDLNSHAGQAVLGHELSHVVAQSQGIGTGSGFLGNASLERQADVEGERAASGMRAAAGSGLSMETSLDFSSPTMNAGGMESTALTPISATAGAFGMGAPMQGDKNKGDDESTGTSSAYEYRPPKRDDLPENLKGMEASDLPRAFTREQLEQASKTFDTQRDEDGGFNLDAVEERYKKVYDSAKDARNNSYREHLLSLTHVGNPKMRNIFGDVGWMNNRCAWNAEAGENLAGLAPEAALSLFDYTTACSDYNDFLRSGKKSPNIENRNKALTSAVTNYKTKAATTVYRVVGADGIEAMLRSAGKSADAGDFDPAQLKGAMLRDSAYMSTSIYPNFDWPGRFRMAIDIPAGANVGAPLMDMHQFSCDVGPMSSDDRGEFLLRPGLTLQITDVVMPKTGSNDSDKTLFRCKIANISEFGEERR